MADPTTTQSAFPDGDASDSGMTSTSFLTPATNPTMAHPSRHSIDFNDKAPQVMEWTSNLSKEHAHVPPVSTSSLGRAGDDQEVVTPTSSSLPVHHDADLEELHKLTPTLVEVPAADIPSLQNLTLNASLTNPSYLSSKPYSVSGHYARGLEVPTVPSPPSSIIAEPPSPTLSHASLKMGSAYSSTSSNAGEDQEMDQDMDQDPSPLGQTEDSSTDRSESITANANISQSVDGEGSTHDQQDTGAFMVPRREILTKEIGRAHV